MLNQLKILYYNIIMNLRGKRMKEELQRTFDDYLEQFEQDENVCESFKKLLLEHIGLGDVLEPIMQKYLEIATKHAYPYALPLGYAMMFFIYYGKNLDKALSYNEIAREMFMQYPDYQERDGILTVMNNAFLGNIYKGNYSIAYKEILAAMPLAEKGGKITYYSAFLNNGAILLREFGLYQKAIKQVEETLEKRYFIGESNFYTTVFVLSSLYIAIKDTKKVRELLDKYVPQLKKTDYYDVNIFNLGYLDAAILDDNKALADEYYQKIVKAYDFSKTDDMENGEVYFTLARYHMYCKEYDQALKYYSILLNNKEQFFGHKRQLWEEAAKLYECLNDYEKAYAYMKAAHDLTRSFLATIDDIHHHEVEDVWEKNRRLSYEVMYDRLLKMTEFGKKVTSCMEWQELENVVNQHARRIFKFDECYLLLCDDPCLHLYTVQGEAYDLEEHALLADCLKQNCGVSLSNWNCEVNLEERLGKLYDNHSRSMYIQPVNIQENLLALFCMKSNQIENFSRTDQGLLQIFSDYVGIAVYNVRQYADAVEKSNYDYLSGIYNRSALMEYGQEMHQRAIQQGHSLGALMIDIDDFKKINDTYGHILGDRVICEVTSIMERYQQHGIIARFGGEEFILLIDGLSEEELLALAQQIRQACETSCLTVGDIELHFTISIGCCYQSTPPSDLYQLFEEADQLMYSAKRKGKNCVQKV